MESELKDKTCINEMYNIRIYDLNSEFWCIV